jgi:hypothetical protein
LEGVEADEAAAKSEERLMDIGAAFIPHGQAAEAVEPGQRALHHPTMLPQALAGVDALARMPLRAMRSPASKKRWSKPASRFAI